MRQIVAAGLFGALLVGGVGAVQAQELEEVVVEAHHAVTSKQVGRTSSGIPVVEMSVSYRVSTEGLDLSKQVGLEQMEKRVKDAVLSACKDISREWPFAAPTDEECARDAAHKPLEKVHELAHAAAKASPK